MIRILLIDDHTLFRSGVKALLQRQPEFEVVGEASDGLEGVKLVEQVEADGDRDHWFTAQEALEYGFVDRVIDSPQEIGMRGEN